MDAIDIDAAKARLSNLLKRVEQGETILITRDGKPVVRLAPLEPEEAARVGRPARRIGFLKGQMAIPDDFNEMGREEIERMFYGDDDQPG